MEYSTLGTAAVDALYCCAQDEAEHTLIRSLGWALSAFIGLPPTDTDIHLQYTPSPHVNQRMNVDDDRLNIPPREFRATAIYDVQRYMHTISTP